MTLSIVVLGVVKGYVLGVNGQGLCKWCWSIRISSRKCFWLYVYLSEHDFCLRNFSRMMTWGYVIEAFMG